MKAEIKTEVTKKMVEVEQKEEMVVLTFTKKEAEIVRSVFGSIENFGNIRRFTSRVYNALGELDVKSALLFNNGLRFSQEKDERYSDL